MSICVRPAAKEDCPRLLELIRELAEYERAAEKVVVVPEHFEQSGFGPHPVWWAFVAQDSETGLILGFALYYIRYSTWNGQQLYLEDIIVTRSARGKGIGKMLFSRILKEAEEKHFNGVIWQVLDWNTPAIHFYEKFSPEFDQEWITCRLNTHSVY